MASTILILNNNIPLLTTSEKIMQRSKNVHIVKIFTPTEYYQWDMTNFTGVMECLTPDGRYYTSEMTPEDESSKEGYIQYNMNLDTTYTEVAGTIKLTFTFTYVDPDTAKTYIRKTDGIELEVTSAQEWTHVVEDSTLSALDQRIVQLEALANSINAAADAYTASKADNMTLTGDTLQLQANGLSVGDPVKLVVTSTEDDELDAEDGDQDSVINLDTIYI